MEPAFNAPDAHRGDPAVELPAHGAGGPILELVTKTGCHLCEDARAVVTDVAAGLGLGWAEVSIDGDAELIARYGEEIPVVLVDGIQRDFWQIDPIRLRSILSKALAES